MYNFKDPIVRPQLTNSQLHHWLSCELQGLCFRQDLQEKKEEIWLIPMKKYLYKQKCRKSKVITQNATIMFDYTTIADCLRTDSWSNYSHLSGVVNQFMGPTFRIFVR